MAGIGFQLKKLINKNDSYSHKIVSYAYAVLVIYGPMIVCIVCLSILTYAMGIFNVDIKEIAVFSRTIGYIFVLSNVITGASSLVLTRYVSDALYFKDYNKILPSFIGGFIIGVIPGTIIYWIIMLLQKQDLIFIFVSGIFFAVISTIWVLIIYLGALSNHTKILKAFITGGGISIVLMLATSFVPQSFRMNYIFVCLNTGFTVMAALLYAQIKNYFGSGDKSIWDFYNYFKKYPSLIFINLFYILGIYWENFYNFIFIIDLDLKRTYMEPFFLGTFVLIPGMIYFIIKFETAYFEKHATFLETINQKGTYGDITLAKANMVKTLSFEFGKLFRVVLIFGLLISLFCINYLQDRGADEITIWRSVNIALGMGFIVLMYVVKVLFLYYDKKGYAFMISTMFLFFNIGFLNVTRTYGMNHYGIGLLLSGFLTFCIGGIFLISFIKNLHYHLLRMPQE